MTDSYEDHVMNVDTNFGKYATAAWCGVLGLYLVAKAFQTWYGPHKMGVLGVFESDKVGRDVTIEVPMFHIPSSMRKMWGNIHGAVQRLMLWKIPLGPFGIQVKKLVWIGVTSAIVVPCMLASSDYKVSANRPGHLAVSAMPLVFLVGTKNGPLQWVSGASWTAVNILHRWIGRLMLLFALLHMGLWYRIYKRDPQELQENFYSGMGNPSGFLALGALIGIAVSSVKPIREKCRPLFYTAHYVCIIAFLVGICEHLGVTPFVWAVLFIYGADKLVSFLGLRFRYAEITPLPGGVTRVRFRGIDGGWTGGQHCAVNLFVQPHLPPTPERKLSWEYVVHTWNTLTHAAFFMWESHPFTISNAPLESGVRLRANLKNQKTRIQSMKAQLGSQKSTPLEFSTLHRSASGVGGAELYIQSQKDPWSYTHLLHETAICSDHVRDVCKRPSSWKLHALAMISMPRSAPPAEAYVADSVLLVCGGQGITFALGTADEWLGRQSRVPKSQRKTRVRLQISWLVHSPDIAYSIAPALKSLIQGANEAAPHVSLRIAIHVTGKEHSPNETSAGHLSLSHLDRTFAQQKCIQIVRERPNIPQLLDEIIDNALAPPVLLKNDPCMCGTDDPTPWCGCGDADSASVGSMDETFANNESSCCCARQGRPCTCQGCCHDEENAVAYLEPLSGLFVSVCASDRLSDAVSEGVRCIPLAKQGQLGRVFFHREAQVI